MIFDYLKKEVEEQYKRFHERHGAQGGVTHLIPETVLMGLQEMGIEIPKKDDVVAMTKFINYCSDEMVDTKKESQLFAYLDEKFEEGKKRSQADILKGGSGCLTHTVPWVVLKELISKGIVNGEESEFVDEVSPFWCHEFERVITEVINICWKDIESEALRKHAGQSKPKM